MGDDTTCLYWEDFYDTTGGWIPVNLLVSDTSVYWHQATYTDGQGTRGVMWCGDSIPTWATPPGYCDNWIQYLTKEFALPPGMPNVIYSIQYDVEEDYDYVYLDVSNDNGDNYTTLETWNGVSGGFVRDTTSLVVYETETVILRFRFESDLSVSDCDGAYDSDGAVRLDSIQVMGFPLDDFESDNDGWEASFPPGGILHDYSYRFEEIPACEDTLPCDEYCWSWVAYDTLTGVFPFEYENVPIRIGIESPVIDIPPGASKYILKFDFYGNLPANNLVFYEWYVAAPPLEQGGSWWNDSYVRYATSGFVTATYDVTPFMIPGATQMKVRLSAVDMYDEWHGSYPWTGLHTSAPIFDNVAIYALGTNHPGISDDGFPRPCAEDTDGDGVFGTDDLCAGEDASHFDSYGDGCIDDGAGCRHVEYWDRSAFPLTYVINESVAPGITDGSDTTAIKDAMNAWWLDDLDVTLEYGGTTGQEDAQAFDQVNLVTFVDPDYQFGAGVIAVGITTSFTEPAWHDNRWWRPGEMVDADMIFNPGMSFRTVTDGPTEATYIEAVATHEAGHLFGLSHTPVTSSTMYFVLPPGLEATLLEMDDQHAMFKAYGTSAAMAGASRLSGTVTDGYTGEPLPGAAVFAIDAGTGDTTACEYTLPDGTYSFIGLPDEDYYVSVHPLDGTSAVGYIHPAYINHLVASTAVTVFVPESWDSSESAYDDAGDRDPLRVEAGGPEAVADIVTNIDETGPTVTSVIPDSNATDVTIDASVLISFSEPINSATLQGNFNLTDSTTHEFVLGNAAVLKDDSLIAFVPLAELAFETTYELKLETGLQDKFGNGLADSFVTYFRTEPEPDVALTSLSPSKGVIGMIVSLNGKGFDAEPANNTVTFNGTVATISEASPTQLVVTVPEGATSGAVSVYNHIQGFTSNELQFTVLSTDEVPRGFKSDMCALSATPWDLTVLPSGDYVFVATEAGAEVVNTDPASGQYLTATTIPIAGGLSNIAAGPAGNRVYAVSNTEQKFYRINSTPGSMVLLSEKPIGAVPRGIAVHPKGHRALIPTDEGDIQIWDIEESSPSFETQIGHIAPVDPNVRGELATYPAGDILLAITGTGKMFVANLDSNEVTDTVSVGVYPEDIVIDALGNRAYSCDETGFVSIISLTEYVSLWKVQTGGALQAIALTPAGSFAIVVDRELNLLSAIDLRETSSSYLGVVATVQLPVNPVDIELSPDGDYAYTISEAEKSLVATTLGVGPSLITLSRYAGPVSTRLVLAGSGFSVDSSAAVSFDGITASPERQTDSCLTVKVPGGAPSGEVFVITDEAGGPELESNSIHFDVLAPIPDDMLRLAASLPGTASPASNGGSVMQVSPGGDYIVLADSSGSLHMLVTDTGSAQFHQYAGSYDLGSPAADIVITPDGQRAFAVMPDSDRIEVIRSDLLKPDFLTSLGTIDFSGIVGSDIARASMSLDGSFLLVSDPGVAQVHFVDIIAGSPTEYQVMASVDLAGGAINGLVYEMAFHPGGQYAYLPVHDASPAVIRILDAAPESPTYQTVVHTVALPGTVPHEMPISLSFTPSGNRCLILTSQYVGAPNRSVLMLNSYNPAAPVVSATLSLGGTTDPVVEHIDISPRSGRAIANVRGAGLFNIEIQKNPDSLIVIQQIGDLSHHMTTADGDYSPDASKFYSLSESSDTLSIYDFSEAQAIAIYSGNGQSGVVNEVLSQRLRVQVTGAGGPVAGVPVDFGVTSGGGCFSETDSTAQVVSTDIDGIAESEWTLGPDVGPGSQTVQAGAKGLSGSPVVFTADGLVDPTTLPLTVSSVTPDSGAIDISIATATQTTFSRAVDSTTVNNTTFYMHEGDFYPVPAVIGFADDNRRVSLSPLSTLNPDATYWIEMTAGIMDEAGGPLEEAVTSVFTTQSPPAIELRSIKPVSGPVGASVVLSGAGFNDQISLNLVLFDSLEAFIDAGGTDFLSAIVPIGAETGCVQVTNTALGDTSNTLEFTVLPPDASPLNNVVGSISTTSATRSVSITPDGAIAYAVSPDADKVTVIDLNTLVQLTSIPVGDNPVAVSIDPEGTYAYVANYVDGTASIIDVYPGSPTYNQVVDVFPVGIGPTDLVVTPDGDRLVVANAAANGISIMDTDPLSETYRSVVSSIATGSGSRTVAITPDGGLIYVGTDNGYIVISALSYGVVASVATGSGSRTVSITPDGGLLVVLTTEGVVNIYDIREGSATENQVVASVQTGSGTVSVAISPDGGFLYMIQEVGDVILVGIISIYGSYGAITQGAGLPPSAIEVTIVDTLVAGEDPSAVAFYPSGSGGFIVTNAGDLTVTVFGDPAAGTEPVERFQRLRSFPNPFNQSAKIRFAIAKPAHVRLALYDVRGRLVRTIIDEARGPGVHTVVWEGRDRRGRRVASGIYFCRLEAGALVDTQKMLLLR
jgi:YVTN family beta-propeller protein